MVRESDNVKNFCQLCEPRETIPISDEYIYEIKLDGERVKAIKKGSSVNLINRRGFNKNAQYPEVVEELKSQEHDFILDGEIACADIRKGLDVLNRRALQTNPLKIKFLIDAIPIKFYVFDILEVDGKDVSEQPLLIRKTILNSFLLDTEHIEIVKYWFRSNVNQLWKRVERENLEGIIAKKKNSPYRFERNENWIKVKLARKTIVNCLGYKEDSSRSPFGSMITDKGNVSLLTQENKDFYLKNRPEKAIVKYYHTYPSGKLRNGIFIGWF
jgi:ATP-dependent DNA ligase